MPSESDELLQNNNKQLEPKKCLDMAFFLNKDESYIDKDYRQAYLILRDVRSLTRNNKDEQTEIFG